jgi:threonine synthase
MWKAFAEMEQMGWIGSPRPRMVAVQSEGCAPIVRAFHEGAAEAAPFPHAQTFAAGIRVPAAIGDFIMLDLLRASGGTAVAVPDEEIREAMSLIARTEGLIACPEGAATVAGARHLRESGFLNSDDRVVLYNTGSGLKYPESIPINLPLIGPDVFVTKGRLPD